MAVIRADSGGLTLLKLQEPTLRPGVERVLLAALSAMPEKSYAEEVLQLAAHAPTALAVETSAPGWPWLARDAFTAEAEGDPDGCVRLAAAALPRSTSPNREPIEDQLLRCAWDARDAEATMLTLVSVAGVLTRGSVEQEAARMVHVGRAEWALRLLDAAPPPAKEDPDWNAYRVQTLLALGRLDDALTFARAHPAGHDCHADLAAALQRAGRRADSAEVRAMPDVEPDWGVP